MESAKDSGQLLSLMLGLDDVENIGRLAGAIARNRTGLSNKTIVERDQAWKKLLESIEGLQDGLKETSESRKFLKELIAKKKPPLTEIKNIGEVIKTHCDEANQSIAKALGLPNDDGDSDEEKDEGAKQVSESLADFLRSAAIGLKKGVESCFPVLNSLNPDTLKVEEPVSDSSDWLKLTDKALNDFFKTARERIKERLDWLRQKDKTGPKADLYLQASKFYVDQTGECPVCEETISLNYSRQALN